MNDLKYCVPEWALPCMPCLEDEEAREKRKINQKIDQQIKKEKVRHRRQVCSNGIKNLENSQKFSFETLYCCQILKLEMSHSDWLKFFRFIYKKFFKNVKTGWLLFDFLGPNFATGNR